MDPSKRFFEDMTKVAGGAASALSGLKTEVETMVRHKMERLLGELDIVRRDEFDALKAIATKARTEQAKLKKRIDVLEAGLGVKPAKKPRPASRTKARAKAPSKARPAAKS